jgi:phage tail-like protein
MTDAPRPPLAVAHVTSAGRRYPGENLTLFTRVEALEALPAGFKLQISLPAGLTVGSTRASASHGPGLADLLVVNERRYLYWSLTRPVAASEQFEYEAEAALAATQEDLTLESTALVTAGGDGAARVEETVEVLVCAQGRYARHLPAIYQADELMGRFLMLFESFWAPITQQIDQMHYYFNPKLTPPEALGWLAQWVDLQLDEHLTVAQQRHLLSTAAAHYRRRGSRQGLTEMLEIYTGVTPTIIEHTARNLRLGPTTLMGPSIALGTSNQPHAFTVILRLPRATGPDAAKARKDLERRVTALIEAEKPAHTIYTLRIETLA